MKHINISFLLFNHSNFFEKSIQVIYEKVLKQENTHPLRGHTQEVSQKSNIIKRVYSEAFQTDG